uniref:Peptide-N(4)-(N-acetyl-beta-glucosaminyl)asparagine amidase n=1 Tax=Chenopodium quinoa TaxID=63459 RepID=A0A803KPR6_CHEQI
MVARKLLVRHENSTFDIDYDTDDGLEVFKFQLFSLTSIPPDEQKILCDDDHHDIKIISDDSDLNSIEEKLRLISIEEDAAAQSSATGDSHVNEELLKTDEEYARLLQAEEEALLFQQYVAPEENGQIEEQLRGYIDKVFMYEDPTRQEAARKTVPVDELEEKALVAIAKKVGWVNAPPCDSCGNQTIGQGMGVPLPAEMKYGGSRVELYRCSFCSRITRFPRYNDPIKILETKKGRCGEWANCFTLYCRAFGYESRLVLTHRNITTEQNLCKDLEKLTKQCRKVLKPEEISLLEERYKIEKEAIERDLHSKGDAAVSLPGRLSGDKQWRISRSEYESGKDGLSCTTCPVRLCVDEHVSDIYNSLGVVISQFADSSLSVSGGVDALKTLRRILTDCQKCPFRSRKIIKTSYGLLPSLHHLLPAFGKLMNTLYLKFELDTKNEVLVHMVGHPIKTSLALPVALDALEDMIVSLAKCPSISKDSLSLPLLRLNRIHSGSVLASGEELPFGIATSAFDGLQSSKWKEPNGAKGGWIAYKLKEEQMCEVVAYELMSANDAPERDPMDWIVEGSSDGGSNWYVLDRQTSQKFDSRFQRKLYRVGSRHTQSNAIRFTFLSVRDVKSTSRLQIGSIDLYAGNC